MEAMPGISLYNYPYVKLAKTLSYYCLCLLFNKIGEEGRTGSCLEAREVGENEEGRGGPNNARTYG
jgi:hypothetical protein